MLAKPGHEGEVGSFPIPRHEACLTLEHPPPEMAAPGDGIAAVLRRGRCFLGFGEEKKAPMIPAFLKKTLRYGIVFTALAAPFYATPPSFAQG